MFGLNFPSLAYCFYKLGLVITQVLTTGAFRGVKCKQSSDLLLELTHLERSSANRKAMFHNGGKKDYYTAFRAHPFSISFSQFS